jgi:steroid delta-isomerase-like uncharacterized protein
MNQSPFLVNWVKGAYRLELGLAPMLEQQMRRLDEDTELHKSLRIHLEKTRRHASLLHARLEALGEDVSSVTPLEPATVAFGHVNGGRPDTVRQTELLDYVTESFEVAAYRALRSLAEMVGDVETSRMSDQILADELALSDILHRRIPGENGGHLDSRNGALQGNIMLAYEVYAALNAHDLDRFERLLADDYRAELPVDASSIDRAQNRTRLQGFFSAIPDLRYELNRVSAGGDSVFVEWRAGGIHAGPYPMLDGVEVPPTGKAVQFSGVTIMNFYNGKLKHSRIIMDRGSLLQQFGIMPDAHKSANPPPQARGDIVYLEIPVTDRKAAAHFYYTVFGWKFEHLDGQNRTNFRAGAMEGGFVEAKRRGEDDRVLFCLYSPDIEGDLRRAESLGAQTIMQPADEPGPSRFAILCDPSGNRIGLRQTTQID